MPKYYVTGSIEGSFSRIIDAESMEDARAKFDRMADDDDFDFDPGMDSVDDVRLGSIRPFSDMLRKTPGAAKLEEAE